MSLASARNETAGFIRTTSGKLRYALPIDSEAPETMESECAVDSEAAGMEMALKPMKGGNSDISDDSDLSDGDGVAVRTLKTVGSKNADPCADGFAAYLKTSLTELWLSNCTNVLLICTPLTILSEKLEWGKGVTFILSILALLPWGERISWVTEDWVKYTNETAGGLFLASVGNLTEIVFCINCLRSGLLRVVQVSMLGSVLSNLLLVLGCAFLVGGTKWDEQSFNKVAAVTNSGLLFLAVLALSLPSILDATHTGTSAHTANNTQHLLVNLTLPGVSTNPFSNAPSWTTAQGSLEGDGGDAPAWLSRFIAGILIILYCLLIYFQFVTHTHLFEDDDDDDEPGILGLGGGAFWMVFITCFIWLLSEYVVQALEEAAQELHIPVLFLSGIIVPIVGNAVEHASAVCFAMHNKMEISLGVAVGSAVQISIFVIPLNVLCGWAMDQRMTLNFHIFETVVLLLTCMAVGFMVSDGKSHWLKGAMLVAAYLIIAAAFWAHGEPSSMMS